jgi:lysophospholipase L1-like esterase
MATQPEIVTPEIVTPDLVRLALLGDSITHEAEPELRATLEATSRSTPDGSASLAGWAIVSLVGVPGATIGEMQAAAQATAALAPDLVVVNLGTNDALKSVHSATTLTDLDTLLATLGTSSIVAVTVTTRFTDSPFDVRAQAINDELRSRSARAEPGRLVIVAWDEIVAADAIDHPVGDSILSDGLHPTPRGRRRLATAVAAGVDEAATA